MNKISFRKIADIFLFSFFVLPTNFGIRVVFFDLTAFRFMLIILLYMILKSKKKSAEFRYMIRSCKHIYVIALYMFVVTYTNLLHGEINQILYWCTNGVLLFFTISYLIQYHYGMAGFLDKIKKYAAIICIISPLELIIGYPPFAYLDTLNKSTGVITRFGDMRILGNCTTNNGYGLYLLILLSIICMDYERNKINIIDNIFWVLLISFNIVLTGARLATGLVVLLIVLLTIISPLKELKKLLLIEGCLLMMIGIVLIAFQDIGMCQSIIRTILTAVDTVLGSNYSTAFGAEVETLYNSAYYRELLVKNTIFGDWLNPWYGRGANYFFGMYIEGYRIYSIDNFYVAQYIYYAWPGVVTWLLMSASFFKNAIFMKVNIAKGLASGMVVYFIGLWYLDHLQTFPFMFAVFAIIFSLEREGRVQCSQNVN